MDENVTLLPPAAGDPALLPCPFCGESKAYFIETEDDDIGKPRFHVCCDECEAQSFGCYCLDKISAAIEWNRRC